MLVFGVDLEVVLVAALFVDIAVRMPLACAAKCKAALSLLGSCLTARKSVALSVEFITAVISSCSMPGLRIGCRRS